MSSLNLKPSPQNLLIAGAILWILTRKRTVASTVTTSAQPTTGQNYDMWKALGLPQIANSLINATINSGGPVSPSWVGNTPTTPAGWTVDIAGAPHVTDGNRNVDPVAAADFWGGVSGLPTP